MKLFLLMDKYKTQITIAVILIVCISIGISVYVFDNDYWNTNWHWGISWLGAGIMYIANFIIKNEL